MVTDDELKRMADKLRIHSIEMTTKAGSGHPTTCMSAAEIMSTLFFSQLKHGDEFILSKGHAAPILWAAMAESGLIDKEKLMTLRNIDSELEGHPTPRNKYVKVATGSLGQGLSAGVGMALGLRLKKTNNKVYVLIGDGECAEGSVWEAANSASLFNLDNIIALIDVNRLGQSGQTMFGHDAEQYRKRFEAFGWETIVIDGHDISQLKEAYAKAGSFSKPFAIIAKTFKGRGVSFIENKEGWHGKPLSEDDMKKAIAEIGETDIELQSAYKPVIYDKKSIIKENNNYSFGDLVATRSAYGKALVKLGKANDTIVAVDGDVRNSTMEEDFFKEFSQRGFNTYIAEQNMVGIAIGLSAVGLVPFASTFATFFTRAHDFIRMAAYSRADIKLVGSHSGVHIGEDGPSQMGLEDTQMFLPIPDAVVLYPSDAISTEKLTAEMAEHKGLSYMRTTRAKTPVIYKNDEMFPIGGLKVLRSSDNDKALVIGAGITLHETLKAYDTLKAEGTNIRVIDLYSIKPVDEKALIKNANDCNGNVIVVEDNYFGAIGAVVSSVIGKIRHLYIKETPRSGKPDELIAKYKVDAQAIIDEVKSI